MLPREYGFKQVKNHGAKKKKNCSNHYIFPNFTILMFLHMHGTLL